MAKRRLRLSSEMWRKAPVCALDEQVSFQEIVERALEQYLKGGGHEAARNPGPRALTWAPCSHLVSRGRSPDAWPELFSFFSRLRAIRATFGPSQDRQEPLATTHEVCGRRSRGRVTMITR